MHCFLGKFAIVSTNSEHYRKKCCNSRWLLHVANSCRKSPSKFLHTHVERKIVKFSRSNRHWLSQCEPVKWQCAIVDRRYRTILFCSSSSTIHDTFQVFPHSLLVVRTDYSPSERHSCCISLWTSQHYFHFGGWHGLRRRFRLESRGENQDSANR